MTETLEQLINELALARAAFAADKQAADERQKQLLEDPELAILKGTAAQAAEEVARLESQIKSMALALHVETGTKAPHPKVAIKTFKTFVIRDPEAMRKWVVTNLPAALKVDEKKVEKYAHEFGEVDGTETGTEPRAQIASAL